MSTMAAQPATTPIPVQLSEPECDAFLLPHLSMPKRGPKCKLGYYRVFNLILWVLYTGMQWKCLPMPTDAKGKRPSITRPSPKSFCAVITNYTPLATRIGFGGYPIGQLPYRMRKLKGQEHGSKAGGEERAYNRRLARPARCGESCIA